MYISITINLYFLTILNWIFVFQYCYCFYYDGDYIIVIDVIYINL